MTDSEIEGLLEAALSIAHRFDLDVLDGDDLAEATFVAVGDMSAGDYRLGPVEAVIHELCHAILLDIDLEDLDVPLGRHFQQVLETLSDVERDTNEAECLGIGAHIMQRLGVEVEPEVFLDQLGVGVHPDRLDDLLVMATSFYETSRGAETIEAVVDIFATELARQARARAAQLDLFKEPV